MSKKHENEIDLFEVIKILWYGKFQIIFITIINITTLTTITTTINLKELSYDNKKLIVINY